MQPQPGIVFHDQHLSFSHTAALSPVRCPEAVTSLGKVMRKQAPLYVCGLPADIKSIVPPLSERMRRMINRPSPVPPCLPFWGAVNKLLRRSEERRVGKECRS